MRWTPLFMLVSCGIAWADRLPDRGPSPRALLVRGRALADRKRYAEAAETFLRALEQAPRDPELLSELGLAQLRLHQTDAARITTEAAIARARSDAERAAAEYNLGRIDEADWSYAAAAAAYERSLERRPNPIVGDRRIALASRFSGEASALLGPFSSKGAVCAALASRETRSSLDGVAGCGFACDESSGYASCRPVDTSECRHSCDEREIARITRGLPRPLSEIDVFASAMREVDRSRGPGFERASRHAYLDVAVRAGSRWYLAPALESYYAQSFAGGAIGLVEARSEPLRHKGASAIVLRLRADWSFRFWGEETERLIVIGVGPSGRPSAVLGPRTERALRGPERNTGFPIRVRRYSYDESARGAPGRDRETVTRLLWRIEDDALVIRGATSRSSITANGRKRVRRSSRRLDERHELSFL